MAKDVGTAIRKSIVVSFLPCLVAFLGFHPYIVPHFFFFFCNFNLIVRRQKSVYIRIQFQPPMSLLLYCLERGVCVLGTPLVNVQFPNKENCQKLIQIWMTVASKLKLQAPSPPSVTHALLAKYTVQVY